MKAPDRLVDTNLIVRHLVQDHKEHSKVASLLFATSDAGRLSLVVLPTVLAESTKLHFVDCLVAAQAVEKAIPIATFDKGISKFSDVTVSVEAEGES